MKPLAQASSSGTLMGRDGLPANPSLYPYCQLAWS